jgi:hypothetical protein
MSKIVDTARDLPKDPGLALATFADRASQIITRRLIDIEEAEFVIDFVNKFSTKFYNGVKFEIRSDESRGDYASRILRNLNGDLKPKLLTNSISREVDDIINEFLDERDESFGLARLNEEERAKIHIQIKHIREIMASSVLSDRKKNALYERLNRLASEVDAHGTRTERFFSFMGDVAFVMGDMAEKAKPLFNEVKEMMRILARSRARQEGVSLPPGDDVIFLPKPRDEA